MIEAKRSLFKPASGLEEIKIKILRKENGNHVKLIWNTSLPLQKHHENLLPLHNVYKFLCEFVIA